MRMTRFGMIAAAFAASLALLTFQSSISTAQTVSTTTAATATNPGNFGAASPVAVGVTAPGTPVVVATTEKPDYTFSGGDWIGSAINWFVLAFGGVITLLITAGLVKFLNWMGVKTNQDMNDRLKELIQNGLNKASAKAQTDLSGKFPVTTKNAIIGEAITYAQEHGADIFAKLGLDPKSGEVVEALRAKAETVIADPNTATNPGLVSNPVPAK